MCKFFLFILGLNIIAAQFPLAWAVNENSPKLDKSGHCEWALVETATHNLDLIQAQLFAESLDFSQIRNFLNIFSGSTDLPGSFSLRERNSDASREIVRQWLHGTLRSAGLQPGFEVFSEGANVVVEIAGGEFPQEVLELGAHFDSTQSGADDNGSGVALLIQLARELPALHPKRSVRLVFFDLAERNCLGSCFHVREMVQDKRHVLGSILVNRIGYTPESNTQWIAQAHFGTQPASQIFARDIFYALQRLPGVHKVQLSAESELTSPDAQDQKSYWEMARPALLISAPAQGQYLNPNHKRIMDSVQNMNWDYYVAVGRLIAEVTAYMAGVPHRPAQIFDSPRGLELLALEDLSISRETRQLPEPTALDPELIKPPKKEVTVYLPSPWALQLRPLLSVTEQTNDSSFFDTYGYSLSSFQLANWISTRQSPAKERVLVISKDWREATVLLNKGLNHYAISSPNFIRALAHEFTVNGGHVVLLDSSISAMSYSFLHSVGELIFVKTPTSIPPFKIVNFSAEVPLTIHEKMPEPFATTLIGEFGAARQSTGNTD